MIKGSLKLEIVRRVMRQGQRQWLSCYARHGPTSPKPVKATLHFEVTAAGRLQNASAQDNGDEALNACLARTTPRFMIPAPPDEDVVSVDVSQSRGR